MTGQQLRLVFGRLRISMTEDPDTPVMVYCRTTDGLCSATFHCAWDTAEVDGEPLTEKEQAWLGAWEPRANEWYNEHRVLS